MKKNFSHREMTIYLKDKGWSMLRSGKHNIFCHPDSKERIPVPQKHSKGHMSPGTVGQILNIVNNVGTRSFRGSCF